MKFMGGSTTAEVIGGTGNALMVCKACENTKGGHSVEQAGQPIHTASVSGQERSL